LENFTSKDNSTYDLDFITICKIKKNEVYLRNGWFLKLLVHEGVAATAVEFSPVAIVKTRGKLATK
jgi:hypothetical protein